MGTLNRWTGAIAVIAASHFSYAAPLEKAENIVAKGNTESLQTQNKIQELDDSRLIDLDEAYRLEREAQHLEIYNKQLEKLIANQDEEIARYQQELGEIDSTNRAIVPLMIDMLLALKTFIGLDLPFLVDERNARVARLEQMLQDPGVSVAEKYRRILEAYQIEAEYGNTIESYVGKVRPDINSESTIQAKVLRFGRVSLVYQTLNGQNAYYWDQNQKKWMDYDVSNFKLNQAFAVAEKSRAPQLIDMPVAKLVQASSVKGDR